MRYQGIKVTVVTGFLGAGKTTLIRHLLTQAPSNERWAVLVNEFGDIGLDSAFYADLGVAIREVPGGCVCCTTSAAFQQGLNQLIRQYNPDRIFIEPSGLGHPKQIIQKLRSDAYQDVLLLSGVFCVLDARHLGDERYTNHATFNDQIDVAGGIVLSHVDRYQQSDMDLVDARFSTLSSSISTQTVFRTDPMMLPISELDIGLKAITSVLMEPVKGRHSHEIHRHQHSHENRALVNEPQFYQKQQDAMQVLGWRWPHMYFDKENITSMVHWMAELEGIYRIKGVFAMNASEALLVNVARGEVCLNVASWQGGSRVEVIGGMEGNWPTVIRQRCENDFT